MKLLANMPPTNRKALAIEVNNLRRSEAVFALLLHVHQAARVVGIFVAIKRVADPLRVATGRLRPIHGVALLDAPDGRGVVARIGCRDVAEEFAVQFPAQLSIRRERAEHGALLAHCDVKIAVRIHAETADAPEFRGRDLTGRAGADAAAVAERFHELRLVRVGHIVEQHLLPRAGAGVRDHQRAVVGQRERHRLKQFRERHRFAIASNALGRELPFLMFRIGVVDFQLPEPAQFVAHLQAVWIHVGVADHVAVLVNAELLPAFVPMAPSVHRAVGLHLGVDEKVLHPLVARAGEGVANPGDGVIQRVSGGRHQEIRER